jgi:hypothetical protein
VWYAGAHQIQFLGTSESNLKTNRVTSGVEVPTVSESDKFSLHRS